MKPTKAIICEFCSIEFTAKEDHGVWPRFCSRKCFKANAIQPAQKDCKCCGKSFLAGRTNTGKSKDGLRDYCSVKCAQQGSKRAVVLNCLQCGKEFDKKLQLVKRSGTKGCCSKECKEQYYVGEKSAAFKGGHYNSPTAGHGFTYLVREGYAGTHIQDHRLAASKYLGRMVERGEVVICINKNKKDVRWENLFVCASMSEYARRRSGSLPWPTQTNIVGTLST